MNSGRLAMLAMIGLVLLLTGCASSRSGDVYSREEARQQMTVEFGVVEHVRSVLIEGTEGSIGAGAGAIVGGIAGSTVGGGRGSAIAAVLGAVAGGMLGAGVEEEVTKKAGVEISVRLDNGGIRAYVQEARPGESFLVGERVRVLQRGGTARVSH